MIIDGDKPKNTFNWKDESKVVQSGPYKGYKENWMNGDKLAKKMRNNEIKLIKTADGEYWFVPTGKDSTKIPAYKMSMKGKNPTLLGETNDKVKAFILDMPAIYTCKNCRQCAGTCFALGSQIQRPQVKLRRLPLDEPQRIFQASYL